MHCFTSCSFWVLLSFSNIVAKRNHFWMTRNVFQVSTELLQEIKDPKTMSKIDKGKWFCHWLSIKQTILLCIKRKTYEVCIILPSRNRAIASVKRASTALLSKFWMARKNLCHFYWPYNPRQNHWVIVIKNILQIASSAPVSTLLCASFCLCKFYFSVNRN